MVTNNAKTQWLNEMKVDFSILLHGSLQSPLGFRMMENQHLWTLPHSHRASGFVVTRKVGMENHTLALKCFCLECTWMISAHISLDKASQMTTVNIKGAGTFNPLMSRRRQELEILASTASMENYLVVKRAKHNWKYPGERRQLKNKISGRISCRAISW